MSGKWKGRFAEVADSYINLMDYCLALEAAHDNLAAELAKRDESGPIVVTDEMATAAFHVIHPTYDAESNPITMGIIKEAVTAALEAGRS